MTEVILGILLALLNFGGESWISRRAGKLDASAAIHFQLKWSGMRIFGLMTLFAGVILLANISLIPFAISFIICYGLTVVRLALQYGTA